MKLLRDLIRRWRLPDAIEPTTDLVSLRDWIRFPVEPASVRWRLVRRASSGRIGILWFELHVLARFDGRWPAITADLAHRSGHGIGIGTQFWEEFIPVAEQPMIAGPDNARGTHYEAKDLWVCRSWKPGASSWICPLAEPYVLGAWSSESVDF